MNMLRYVFFASLLGVIAACGDSDEKDKPTERKAGMTLADARPASGVEKMPEGRRGDGSGQGGGSGSGGAEAGTGQGRFPSGTDREWEGFAKGRCGGKIHIVDAHGVRHDFERPSGFYEQFERETVVTAEENEREIFSPLEVFRVYGGERMRLKECERDKFTEITRDNASDFAFFINGRGLLKVMKRATEESPALAAVRILDYVEIVPPASTEVEK